MYTYVSCVYVPGWCMLTLELRACACAHVYVRIVSASCPYFEGAWRYAIYMCVFLNEHLPVVSTGTRDHSDSMMMSDSNHAVAPQGASSELVSMVAEHNDEICAETACHVEYLTQQCPCYCANTFPRSIQQKKNVAETRTAIIEFCIILSVCIHGEARLYPRFAKSL
jgi:hypothetical protein